MFKSAVAFVAVLVASAQAGTVLWDGTLDAAFTSASFDKWSWGNQVGPYQWYIHGPSATSNYLGVSSSFKNPADTTSAQGIRTTIDGTAFWNGQTMARTEIIPQTTANLGSGHLYYHFSLRTSSTNAPNPKFEHQIAFFESHFVELKYGLLSGASGTSDNTLRFMISQNTKWSTQLAPDTWYNFAYDIDFNAKTAGLWFSTGGSPLTQVVANQAASTSTNSADFHVGVLRLPNGGTSSVPEDYFWSGVYVESGSITTSIAGPRPGTGGSGGSGTTVIPTTSPVTTSKSTATTSKTSTVVTTTVPTTAAPSGTAVAQHYAQCGGKGWSGPTVCADGYTCKASGEYYSQCL